MRAKRGGAYVNIVLGALLIVLIGVVATAVLMPVFKRTNSRDPRSTCQSNLKELGIALALYYGDYDAMLPSSILCGGGKTWSPGSFSRFAKEQGTLPPPPGAKVKTWPMLLYPYIKNKDIIWCPSDPEGAGWTPRSFWDRFRRKPAVTPRTAVSYYWKAAIDRAWYGDKTVKARKEADFKFPGDQIFLYEHNSWHWGEADRGLIDGVTINCAFLDGHVQSKRIAESGYTAAENPPEPLPKSGVGEPAWFNYSFGSKTPAYSRGANWNPKVWGDNLPP